MAKFDDSPFDTIVFDEIFFSCVRKLARIKRYCEERPEKIVIATGDTNQLECIDLRHKPARLRRLLQQVRRHDLP